MTNIAPVIRKHILLNLPYLMFFWLAGKLAEAYRLAPGADISAKVTNIRTGFSYAFDRLAPTFYPSDMLFGIIIAVIMWLVVWHKKQNAKKFRKDIEHGSARWGSKADIAPFMSKNPDDNIILTQSEMLTMNPRPSNPAYARNKNMLVIGGSGSGKTRFVLKPNLMQCKSETYPVSFVVTDPKASILTECGRLLHKKYGYRIKVLNTINFGKSMHYNPFVYIKKESDILKLVTTLIANTTSPDKKGGDEFWQKSEVLLYTALIAYLFYEAPKHEQNFATLAEMISSMEVKEEDEDFKNIVDLMFDRLEERDPDHFAVRQYRKFRLAAGKTLKSILVSCGARLAPFDIKEIRAITMYDELELDTLGDEKTALFIIISDTDASFNFLVSMAYTQLFNLLCEKADDVYGGRLPVHVRCLVDEAANIGQIPNLEKLMATIRSREISACLVLQAQSQLKALYKDNASTIIGNCDSAIFLGGKEKETLEEWSKILGKETIFSHSTSETKGNSPSYGRNLNKLGKDLMSPDELATMPGDKCILQLRGVRPFLSKKYDITKHPHYKYLSDFDKRNEFNIEKFLSTKLKLKQNDMFEVHEVDLDETLPADAFIE